MPSRHGLAASIIIFFELIGHPVYLLQGEFTGINDRLQIQGAPARHALSFRTRTTLVFTGRNHMPKREDINTILLVGSGPIVNGQACEVDY